MDKTLLARCENEALHRSGAIQPHGTLLVVDARGRVSHVAENIAAFLGPAPEAWLDRPLPSELAALIAELGPIAGSRRIFPERVEGGTGPLDVVASRGADGECVLEFVPHMAESRRHPAAIQPLPEPPQDEETLARERQRLVEEIAALIGFQRVMFYLFREDGDGEVVAEARQPRAYGSYLGLRFPASDIPQIARALYLKNPWRMIPDAAAAAVPVRSRDGSPPDLTWSDLRSVSPVHAVYLANMGVAASLSFPVVANANLVALVAAHHREPRRLALGVIEHAAAQVRGHAFAHAGYQSQRRIRLVDGLPYRFAPLEAMLRRHGDPASCWPELAAWLQREFRADGTALCIGERVLTDGLVLEGETLAIVDEWFCQQQDEFVFSSDSLVRLLPGFPPSAVAGVTALRLGGCGEEGRGVRLYLTRAEYVHEVAWGGNPDKPVELHDGVLGIAPRRSFEKWLEKRLGYSRPWDNETRLMALRLRETLQRALRP